MRRLRDRLPPAVRDRPVPAAVALLAALALLARFWALGWRMPHQDEARVAYRVLQYAETGSWSYNPALHGPFLFHVDRWVFTLFGATDATARAVVALVGGLLPLSALLFRDRLRDGAVVALAAFLAVNPLLLYYSRFMRNDVLVGAFALTALGFFVRAYDRGSRRDFYAGVAVLALSTTTKENFLVYLGLWAGALALLVDHELFLSGARGEEGLSRLLDRAVEVLRGLWGWRTAFAVGVLEFLAVVVLFYAPRPDLYQAFTAPGMWPDVVAAGTVGAWEELWGMWVSGAGGADHPFVDFLKRYVEVLRTGALAVVALAALGFLQNRYAGDREPLVAFATFWGVASVPVYAYASDIGGPWDSVHAVVPLVIPAAVGAAALVRRGRAALVASDREATSAMVALLVLGGAGTYALSTGGFAGVRALQPVPVLGLALLVAAVAAVYWLTAPERDAKWRPTRRATVGAVAVVAALLLVAQVGTVAVTAVYLHPQDRGPLVQYGQPSDDMRPALAEVQEAVRANEAGVDVLFYGTHFADQCSPGGYPDFLCRMQLTWYFEAWDATVEGTTSVEQVRTTDAPVVIAPSGDGVYGPESASDLDVVLSNAGYRRLGAFAITQKIPGNVVNAVIWVQNGTATGG